MQEESVGQRTLLDSALDDHIEIWIEQWLIDAKIRNLSPRSIAFYRQKIDNFLGFCDTRQISRISQITPNELRLYVLHLQESHNPGGVHAHYRTVRTFLNFWEGETEPDDWRNPTKKVKPPKTPLDPLEPVEKNKVRRMVEACHGGTLLDTRDRAAILFLFDCGARASEFLSLDLGDLDLVRGEILIRHGKGNKSRVGFLGKSTRKEVRRYLKLRTDDNPAVWINKFGDRLGYDGLRSMLRRRCKLAGIEERTPHDFRRGFSVAMLRAGCDIFSLRDLMGHSDLSTMQRYLKLVTDDLKTAHRRASPVDNIL
jgi:integrase/recombinase XerD